jgi:hypothetical protein
MFERQNTLVLFLEINEIHRCPSIGIPTRNVVSASHATEKKGEPPTRALGFFWNIDFH